jgi:hypothetical protein
MGTRRGVLAIVSHFWPVEKGKNKPNSLLMPMMFAFSEVANVPDEILKGMKLKCLSTVVADVVCSGASGPIWLLGSQTVPTFL